MMFTPNVSSLHLVHRQRYAVHGDAALDRDEARQVASAPGKPSACDPFSGVADTASPTPSTWPDTRCPPSSSPMRNDRSRLTRDPDGPASQLGMRQRLGRGIDREPVRVRTPPPSGSSRNRRSRRRARPADRPGIPPGVAITRRMSLCRSPIGSMARTVPRAVTDSGEHSILPFEFAQHVVTDGGNAMPLEARHHGKFFDPESLHRRPAVAAHDGGGMKPGDPVDQIGPQQGGGDLAAALRPAPASVRPAPSAGIAVDQIDPGGGRRYLDQLRAEIGEGLAAGRDRCRRAAGTRSGLSPAVVTQAGGQRRAQMAVDDDPHHGRRTEALGCGRSVPDCPPARCRRRPAPRHAGRAGHGPCGAPRCR